MRIRRVAAPVLASACAIVCAAGGARAGTAALKHERSIYTDGERRRLEAPQGVACADDGTLVVADTGHGRLVVYRWQEGELRGGEAVALPELPCPARLQLDGTGDLLVLDRRLRRIGRVDRDGRFGGYLDVQTGSGPGIVPLAFKVGPRGRIYVLDGAGRRLLVVEPSGRIAREVALPATGSFTDLALGTGGEVYALDAASATAWVADARGAAFRRLGPSLEGRVLFPTQVASDGRGRLFVVDRHGDAIVVLGEDGRVEARALSAGHADGQLSYAAQICVTQTAVFVADEGNNRVQVFALMR